MLPAFGDSAGESLTFSLSQLINIPAKISENHQINLSFMSGGGERDIKQYISISDLTLYYVDFLLVTIFLMKNSPAL